VRELKEFELISMGLEGSNQENNNKKRKAPTMERENGKEEPTTAAKIDAATEAFRQREVEVNGKRRKVFELGEAEIARYANSELDRLKKKIEQEKVLSSAPLSHYIYDVDYMVQAEAKSALPSFWIPSETPGTENEAASKKNLKLSPICPGSTKETRHEYSLKTLVDVHFTEEKSETGGSISRICPSCKKSLTNGLKAMRMSSFLILPIKVRGANLYGMGIQVTKPCGHVICQPCVTKFMTPETTIDPHRTNGAEEEAEIGRMLCYVCETDITPVNKHAKSSKGKHKEEKNNKIRPGLVEIKSEGTGFAKGGSNMAKKQGVAFQC
jgi:nitric oxide synthase-interacting protein